MIPAFYLAASIPKYISPKYIYPFMYKILFIWYDKISSSIKIFEDICDRKDY